MKNDAQRAGQLAAPKESFGDFGRFSVAPVHTRFDEVQWFAWDAERKDDVTDGPMVVAQEGSREGAMAVVQRRQDAISFASDFSKDATGRRFRDFDGMTTEAIERMGKRYAAQVEQQLEDEREDADPDAWKKYV